MMVSAMVMPSRPPKMRRALASAKSQTASAAWRCSARIAVAPSRTA